jgi:ADP-ribosyl-[dinitrogen reductase] hydrolase
MRVAPIALFHLQDDFNTTMKAAKNSSITTHGEQRCIEACQIMTFYIRQILKSKTTLSKHEILFPETQYWHKFVSQLSDDMHAIASGEYTEKSRNEIKGTGFVVQSLEAALWCFYNSDSFAEGALLAANLGDDADTTAAIYGQLAGAYYGEDALPREWLKLLAWKTEISDLAESLVIPHPSKKAMEKI